MTRLQDDLLSIYNSLTDFSKNTLQIPTRMPIKVSYSEGLNSLCFEQHGLKVALSVLNYYCENLKNLKESYLLPDDYDKLMSTLASVIGGGVLLHDRLCLAPKKYGFTLYETRGNFLKEGPQFIAEVNFVSGDSWLFKKIVKTRFKNCL